MCLYYAYNYPCGHTNTIFGKHCAAAALAQRPCRGGNSVIWGDALKMDANCYQCGGEAKAVQPRNDERIKRISER